MPDIIPDFTDTELLIIRAAHAERSREAQVLADHVSRRGDPPA